MSEALLNCPFCGAKGIVHRVPSGWRVSCTSCDCKPKPGLPPKTEAEAIAAWNTRTASAPVATDDETYKIGVDDGRTEMVREIDLATGGDGEFRYCMNGDPERHCPDADTMMRRIVARFTAPVATEAMVEALRDIVGRVQSRVLRGDWIVSGDDSKALYRAERALAAMGGADAAS